MISDFGAQQWAGVMFGIGAVPAQFYVGLATDEPQSGWDGSVVATLEPTDSAYNRIAIATGTGFTLSDGGFVINAVELDYPTPVEDWGTIKNWVLCDALTGGNFWASGEFLESFPVLAGLPAQIPVGSLFIGLDNQVASIAE